MRRRNLLLAMVMLLTSFILKAGDEFEVDGIKYEKINDTSVSVISKNPPYKGKIVIPEYVEVNGNTYKVIAVGGSAFSDCEVNEVILPNSIIKIGRRAFATKSLKKVELSNSLEEIGIYAFQGINIENLYLPPSLKHIGEACFAASKIKEIVIPNSVITIEAHVFAFSALEQIHLGSGLKYLSDGALAGAKSLLNISVDSYNKFFAEKDGVLFNKDYTELIQFPAGRHSINYSVPEQTTSIRPYGFSDCDLKSLNMSNVKVIGYYGVDQCKIENLILPYVSTLGQGAFRLCTISHLVLGNKLASVYPGCFGSSDFEIITYYATSPLPLRSEQYQFSVETYEKAVLRIPIGCMKYYESAPGWKYFEHIEEFDPSSGITEVEGDDNKITWEYNTDEVVIKNPQRRTVGIYDINGKTLYNGNMEIITVPYNNMYIIRYGRNSRKVYFPLY